MQLNKMNESPPKMAYRKTSAEIVSEAKCLLAGGEIDMRKSLNWIYDYFYVN